jgi:diaminohydroxyphosphoribosylaminopyrimidine deaminase/5-amino-6-(5-phosphoribosylamino)uracil reductase
MHNHEYFMAMALQLAERGLYSTSPNPRVGCVVVNHGQVVGQGWHQRAGEPHAEVYALHAAGAAAQGATVYVTLEPCAHHGRTPPCADALIRAGVADVVIATSDPNPLVAGQGSARLQAAGIRVQSGILAQAARELNIGFLSRMERQRPWLRLKVAHSLDGKTALANGRSQWITSAAARQDVQHWRARACAILTGSGTVCADNPQLNVRTLPVVRQPLRVVVDGALRTPPSARIFDSQGVLMATTIMDKARHAPYLARGAEVVVLARGERVDLEGLLHLLAQRGCNEVMTEAGGGLNGALLDAGLVDELLLYQAPVVLGAPAQSSFATRAYASLTEAQRWYWHDQRAIGPDLRSILRPMPDGSA